MKKILLFLTIFFSFGSIFSQDNSTSAYDQVYLKSGRVLTGEILIFQETDGDITFRDLEGNNYSLTRKEYRYFRRNVVVIKDGDTTVIKQRKQDVLGVSIGVQASAPVGGLCFHLSGGKYFGRKNYIGGALDYSVLPLDADVYLNPKAFINHQYDAYKKNISSYIVGELGYAFYRGRQDLFVYNGDQEYRVSSVEQKLNFINFSLGHGFGFYLKNTNYISFELIYSRYFPLSREVIAIDANNNPPSGYDIDPKRGRVTLNDVALRILINL